MIATCCCKYLKEPSDAMIATIMSNGDLTRLIRKTVMAIGDEPGGQEVSLSPRGLGTLKLLMDQVDNAGHKIVRWIGKQDASLKVMLPACESCPGHSFSQWEFTGAAGLIGVTIRANSKTSVHRFVDALLHFGIGVSHGWARKSWFARHTQPHSIPLGQRRRLDPVQYRPRRT